MQGILASNNENLINNSKFLEKRSKFNFIKNKICDL